MAVDIIIDIDRWHRHRAADGIGPLDTNELEKKQQKKPVHEYHYFSTLLRAPQNRTTSKLVATALRCNPLLNLPLDLHRYNIIDMLNFSLSCRCTPIECLHTIYTTGTLQISHAVSNGKSRNQPTKVNTGSDEEVLIILL